MNVDEFISKWRREVLHDFASFSENMESVKVKNMSYAEWLKYWVAWMELETDGDIDAYYGDVEE